MSTRKITLLNFQELAQLKSEPADIAWLFDLIRDFPVFDCKADAGLCAARRSRLHSFRFATIPPPRLVSSAAVMRRHPARGPNSIFEKIKSIGFPGKTLHVLPLFLTFRKNVRYSQYEVNRSLAPVSGRFLFQPPSPIRCDAPSLAGSARRCALVSRLRDERKAGARLFHERTPTWLGPSTSQSALINSKSILRWQTGVPYRRIAEHFDIDERTISLYRRRQIESHPNFFRRIPKLGITFADQIFIHGELYAARVRRQLRDTADAAYAALTHAN